MAAIDLLKLEKMYDNGFQAVKGIDLQIRDKEFMVLVGPSGCGKTTSLRMIAGLEDISGGEIRIGGTRVNDVEPKDRDIAMVFQNYALYPHMTVFENMAYALKLRKVPKAEIQAKVDQAAKMLNLVEQLPKRPKQLSGGQRQRVALGRAIVRQPKVFLFDEPLSNLDAKLRSDMRYELKTLQQRLQTTMVYVTHDQIEAMTLGDRITVMNHGVIQQVAPPTVVYEQPFNRFVASFIGTPMMNFLPGAAVRDGDGWVFVLADGTRIALHMAGKARIAEAKDLKQMVLGIRPEHLLPSGAGPTPAGATVLQLKVEIVEMMGDHQYVYLTPPAGGAGRMIMKCSSHVKAPVGSTVGVAFDTAVGHIFDGTSDDAPNITLPANFPRQQ